MERKLEDFKKKCKAFDINLSEKQMADFLKYYELLTEWNRVMNLTAITEFADVVLKHFVDSLALYQVKSFRGSMEARESKEGKEPVRNVSLIDVGTGAGFPGIPLKIVFPSLKITLLDSLQKRVRFLREVIKELHLENIEAVHGRAEDFAKQKEHREQYDFCVSRAVANFSVLSELCIPFVKKEGYFISYKSEKVKEELEAGRNAVMLLGGKQEECLTYPLPDSDQRRSLIVIKKAETTPHQYPRKAGVPERWPL